MVSCSKNRIKLTCVADGALLSSLHVTDICSIFGNALDNAIEYTAQVADPAARLIHLIVTALFAVMEVICVATLLTTSNLWALALMIMILVLLVPYIGHYYFLENSVQELYLIYDVILSRIPGGDANKPAEEKLQGGKGK